MPGALPKYAERTIQISQNSYAHGKGHPLIPSPKRQAYVIDKQRQIRWDESPWTAGPSTLHVVGVDNLAIFLRTSQSCGQRTHFNLSLSGDELIATRRTASHGG